VKRGNWSVPEVERLRALFPRTSPARAARLLGRSVDSVLRRARQIFAADRRVGPWSDADDRTLREAVGVHDLDTMALLVARAPEDVAARLAELQTERRRGPWLDDEQALLKRLHGTRTTRHLVLVLGRSPVDVERKARELCLGKDKAAPTAGPTRMPRWNAESLARLRELYPTRDNLEIARELGRTVSSIANKASQLGLSKGRPALQRMGRRNVRRRWG
jgi:hypothetical protein